MTSETKKLNIYQRINAVQQEVKYLKKDKKVQSYMAATHDAVTALVRDSCVLHGVLIIPNEHDSIVVDTGTKTSTGTPIIRYESRFTISFVNIDEPEDKIDVSINSHANDTGDKATGKALSYAVKNAMLKTFMIETGESDESRVEPARLAKIKINEEQINWVKARKEELGIADDKFKKVLNSMRIASIEDLNESSLRDLEIRFNSQEQVNKNEEKQNAFKQ